ncbi:MAG: class I tRNA ligase family protein, partial [bacterium]|nr:class I tRNA ligase family protein [bacterium]
MKEIFRELSRENASVVENQITENWKKMNILEKCLEKKHKTFVFYDGPATANGMPGLHHMVAKFLKDAFCKYHTMKDCKVLRKIGWDTHGLPVEVQVEKKLGFKDKTDIEKYGIKKFNDECRKIV